MRIRDPVPVRHLDPGWVKNQDPDTYIYESLETIFWVKNIYFADPGSGIFLPGIRDGKVGSGISIPDPQHWSLA
jgi:hypothetical protein